MNHHRAPAPANVLDPVCGMTISPDQAAGHLDHAGKTYYFCSQSCLDRFKADPGKFVSGDRLAPQPAASAAVTHEYTCPMHPEIVRDAPGSCPICGMALEARVVTLEAANPELDDMTRRFWWSTAITTPILAFMVAELLPGRPLHGAIPHGWMNWIQLALATPVVMWGGWPFFERGWASLVTRHLNMFTLIALDVWLRAPSSSTWPSRTSTVMTAAASK